MSWKEIAAMFVVAYGGKITIAILLGALFIVGGQAHGATIDYLTLNVASHHTDDSYCYDGECGQQYNELNLGLGITHTLRDSVDLSAGFYNNSYNITSVYGVANFNYDFGTGWLVVSPGITIGAVTGYRNTPMRLEEFSVGDTSLLVLPNINFDVFRFRTTVGMIPGMQGRSPLYTLQLGWKF